MLDLLNLSIGTPQRSSVNFSALHALLLAVLEQLGVLQLKTPWREPPPGHPEPRAPVEEEDRPRGSADPDGEDEDDEGLRSRVQTCEDGLSKVEDSF